MGAICHHKQSTQKSYTTRSLSTSTIPQASKIKITTKSINKSGEDCLLLFVDTQCNVRRNQYMNELKANVGAKLQEYLDVELKGKCMNPGDCLVISVTIENFIYKAVALLCINVWQGSNKGLQDPLQDDIEQALDTIKSKNFLTVCLTDFNTEFGIPLHIGSKTLSRVILNKIGGMESMTVACLKEEHQHALLEAIKDEQMKKLGASARSNSLVGSIKSNYY